jgi:hypothetical protein
MLSYDVLQFSIKSDVFSFGVVLQEIASHGKQPYPGAPSDHPWWKDRLSACRTKPEHVARFSKGEMRDIEIIPDNSHPFADIIRQCCWELRPCARPSFSKLENDIYNMSLYEEMNMAEAPIEIYAPPPPPPRQAKAAAVSSAAQEEVIAKAEKEEEEFQAALKEVKEANSQEIVAWLHASDQEAVKGDQLVKLVELRDDSITLQQLAYYAAGKNLGPIKLKAILKARCSIVVMFEDSGGSHAFLT